MTEDETPREDRDSSRLKAQADSSRTDQEIAGAYYDDEISYEQLRSLVGDERAANFRVLKRQLDDDLTDELAEL
ncbi:hypothetical protein [Halorussus salinus]|uniref:hypothetical protein n=1 Tax=Halorussus salinus TaxID=1364935 RepID=UPI00109243A0|nr:hypothetical protein [Halorussus salinus]